MSDPTQPPASLSTQELARLLMTQDASDLQAIEDLPESDRQWLESAIRTGKEGSLSLLLGGIRLRHQFLLNPYPARSHITDLPSWVAVARSQPVALGITL